MSRFHTIFQMKDNKIKIILFNYIKKISYTEHQFYYEISTFKIKYLGIYLSLRFTHEIKVCLKKKSKFHQMVFTKLKHL